MHLVTDESAVYYQMKPRFAQHSTVNHGRKEYSRKEENFTVTTSTFESFFALLKRSNYGIHHHMSRTYLGSYRAERDSFTTRERSATISAPTRRSKVPAASA